MQTSRFQLGLIATLAVGFGFSLSSSDAVGYPAAGVSMGSNPSWSSAGKTEGYGSEAVLVTAPLDQDAMVTDIYFSTNYSSHEVKLALDDGSVVGRFYVHYGAGGEVDRSLSNGIRVPAGRTLVLQWSSSYTILHNVSGYYAHP